MNLRFFIKKRITNTPYILTNYLKYMPFYLKVGKEYNLSKKNIEIFNNISKDEQLNYIVSRLNNIVSYASNNFEFYNNFYKNYGVLNHKIKYLDDFEKYPILLKKDIRDYTDTFNGAIKLNTGGTSGEPFSFFVDKNIYGREWAHMHSIWALRGYKQTDLKITLRGKNLGDKNIIYNPIQNEFVINTYRSIEYFKDELLELFDKYSIKYIHGYPSAIYEFFKELEKILDNKEKIIIEKNLISALFGSEFPMPYMTDYLQTIWNLDYISWYGHSEMAILAYDDKKINRYTPFMTYGYPEIVENKLIGTSYNNYDMPLIRYDTGDLVEGKINENGLLDYFSIKEGREGDFIIDKNNKPIPLTALIFGRHHKIFNIANFIQVSQDKNQKVKFYITLNDKNQLDINRIEEYFDLTNIDIDYEFKIIDVPVRTKLGKIKLKIG